MRELKKTWGVSLQALLFRARTIGLPERAYQRAMRYLSAQGWRLDEPVKLGPTERPTLLPKALELLERNGLPGETLAREAGLPERFLHSVLDRQHEEPPPFPSGVSRLGSVR